MKVIAGLNGVRAIAVTIVIFHHWGFPNQLNGFLNNFTFFRDVISDGQFGVDLFFTLSGFLITTILLSEKKRLHYSKCKFTESKKVVTNFYLRRLLRIFPIYYLAIILLYHTGYPDIKSNFYYYITYTENFKVLLGKSWDYYSHTWSLCVEEQFYLFWPLVILYVPKERLLKTIVAFSLTGPFFSACQYLIFKNKYFVLTPSCLDAFGVGALLAFFYTEDSLAYFKKYIKIALPFCLIFFVYWKVARNGGHFQYFARSVNSVISVAIILLCLSKSYRFLNATILGNKILNQIGIISYGIYLYHYPLPFFYYKFKSRIGFISGNTMDYIFMLVMLGVVSVLSFWAIEKPILALKRYFK